MPRMSNEELVKDLMTRSPHGVLCQTFVLEAIRFYSHIVSTTEPKDNPNALFNEKAWHGIAVDIQARLQKHYEMQAGENGANPV